MDEETFKSDAAGGRAHDTDGVRLTPLPGRAPAAHKGSAGTVTVLGGSCDGASRMIGAPALAAQGALRAGCGLVRVITPEPIAGFVLTLCPSATAVALPVGKEDSASAGAQLLDAELIRTTALVAGPGLGLSEAAGALTLRCVQQEQCPVVLDADSLTLLARIPQLHRDFRARAIVTPHPGEFRRLAGAFNITMDPTDPRTRPAAAEELARRMGCIAVLKGMNTVVTDGLRTWVCRRGHPCLATAGTGDVLAGVIAGLIAQHPPESHNPLLALAAAKLGRPAPTAGLLTLFELACLGVQAHALAGEKWAAMNNASAGMTAGDLLMLIPGAVESLRGETGGETGEQMGEEMGE
jgi:ADP-dependent NAD(P)H-hydrate dehydratase